MSIVLNQFCDDEMFVTCRLTGVAVDCVGVVTSEVDCGCRLCGVLNPVGVVITSGVCVRTGGLNALDDLEGVVNAEVCVAIPEASLDVGVVILEVGVANFDASTDVGMANFDDVGVANFEVGVANIDLVVVIVGVANTDVGVARSEVGVAVLIEEHTGCTVGHKVAFPDDLTSCAKSTVLSANISSISSHSSVSNTSCLSREQEMMSLSLSFDG